MNHIRYRDFLREVGDRMYSEFGIPLYAVEEIQLFAEQTGIIAETRERNDQQYEMQFREYGSEIMGQRFGITPQAARKRFNKIIGKPNKGLVVALRVA